MTGAGGRVREFFADRFGRAAEVVGRAPGRVNLIGEHTDYNAGLCLPIALPQATFAAIGTREDQRLRLVSAQTDDAFEIDLSALAPGAVPGWAAYAAGVVWTLRADGIELPGLDIAVDSDVPVGAGLSSSAALECAVAVAATHLAGLTLDDQLRRRLIPLCIRAEAEMAGAPTGGLDQTASMLSHPDQALLLDFDSGAATPVPLPLGAAGLGLLVIDTRVSHALVDGGYAARRADCEAAAAQLGVSSLRHATPDRLAEIDDPRLRARAQHVITEIARVEDCVAAIGDNDWGRVGELFAASHASLRDDFEVSCPELDLAVSAGTAAGALGVRMTGGGFGGSAVALVRADAAGAIGTAVREAFAAASFAEPTVLPVTAGDGAGLA